MKSEDIQHCYLGSKISPEHFIPDHIFMFLTHGSIEAYDGNSRYSIASGDFYLARKNHLIRYTKHRQDGLYKNTLVRFDEPFLRNFLLRHPQVITPASQGDSFIMIASNELLLNYIQSIHPYYKENAELDAQFADIKREELLLILLQANPDLKNVLFNFGMPDKIDLENFMLRNFRFNVSMERFAFLTGRSESAFKRDFYKIFNATPGAWLKQKRLEEAYFQLSQQKRKANDIYLELGFENLSHFSFAFKKQFHVNPSELK